jgi:hypothetical protein
VATTPMTQRNNLQPYSGKARWCKVRIETETAVYVGRMYLTDGKKRLSDVLCDERPFLNLTEVTINDCGSVESFVALNKNYVRTLRILQDVAEAMASC